MGKIVGNIWCYFLFFAVCSLHAEITVNVADLNGQELAQIGVGQPFLLEVVVTDNDAAMHKPTIRGLDKFDAHRIGFNMTTINGKSTIKYSYRVRIDKEGIHHIGPILITNAHGSDVFEGLDLKVGKDPIQKGGRAQRAKKKMDATLRLTIDKDRVVVGEKVRCSLQLFYNDQRLSCKNIGQEENVSLSRKNVSGPHVTQEQTAKGRQLCAGWEWDIYPQTEGELTIPPCFVDVVIPSERDDFWHALNAVFGVKEGKQRRVYSNAGRLNVDPLPAHAHGALVGTITDYQASIAPTIAKEGEGMVLTLRVQGDLDLDALEVPELQGLPDKFRAYPSKNYIVPSTAQAPATKCFEYIVQGFGAGDYELPKQRITCFNPKTHNVETKETAALFISITPGAHVQEKSPQLSLANTEVQAIPQAVCLLDEEGTWYPQKEFMLPWWLFFLLLSPGIGWLFWCAMHGCWHVYCTRYENTLRKKWAYKTAKKHLEYARTHGDAGRVYEIMLTFFADKLGIPPAQVTGDTIKRYMPESDSQDWQAFFLVISSHRFDKPRAMGLEDERIFFENAQKWLDVLKRAIS